MEKKSSKQKSELIKRANFDHRARLSAQMCREKAKINILVSLFQASWVNTSNSASISIKKVQRHNNGSQFMNT